MTRTSRGDLNYVGDTEGHPDAPANRTDASPPQQPHGAMSADCGCSCHYGKWPASATCCERCIAASVPLPVDGLREALERIAECDSPECGDDHHSVARTALSAAHDKEETDEA